MIVVLSDLHFGIGKKASLENKTTSDKFTRELKNHNEDVEKIILLGDVFDFWQARPNKAIESSISFFKAISELNTDIIYVVGNHDHHLVMMDHEARFIENLRETGTIQEMEFSHNIVNLENFLNKICPTSSISIKYPYHMENISGKGFVFWHGHHLDFFQTLIPKLMTSKIKKFFQTLISKMIGRVPYYPDDEREFETIMSHTYENLYQSAFVGEYAAIENGLWSIPKTAGAFWGGVCKTLRYTSVERQYKSILNFVRKYHTEDPISCFVYGDTHKADIYQKNKNQLLAVNSGCWIREPNREAWGNPEEKPNTYITIDDKIIIKQFDPESGKSKPLDGLSPFPVKDLANIKM